MCEIDRSERNRTRGTWILRTDTCEALRFRWFDSGILFAFSKGSESNVGRLIGLGRVAESGVSLAGAAEMSVGNICSRNLITVDADDAVSVAEQRMEECRVGCLVIVNNNQRPLGMLTDRDLAFRCAQSCNPSRMKVWEVMKPLPQCVGEEASIDEALKLMRGGPYRRLPVVNRNGRAVGLLSVDDILTFVSNEIGEISRLLQQESPEAVGHRASC